MLVKPRCPCLASSSNNVSTSLVRYIYPVYIRAGDLTRSTRSALLCNVWLCSCVTWRLSPATCPLGLGPAQDNFDDSPDSPDLLYDLDSLDKACHPHAQRAASAVVMSREFLSLYSSSTPIGRARLLDGSVTRGPFSFWRRIPIRPEASASEQPHFAFSDPADYPIALALDLLLLPALQGEGDTAVCSRCVPSVPDPSLQALGCRHFVGCPHGIRLGATCHDQAVRTLADCFSAILGSDKVIADRGIGTGQPTCGIRIHVLYREREKAMYYVFL